MEEIKQVEIPYHLGSGKNFEAPIPDWKAKY